MNVHRPLLLTVAFAFGVCHATPAVAQADWRFAISANGIYSTQEPRDLGLLVNSPSIPRPGIGGSAAGVSVNALFPMTRRLGIGIEVSDTGCFEGIQTGRSGSGGTDQRDQCFSDLIISGLLQVRQQAGPRVELDFVAGAGLVFESRTMRIATHPFGGSSFGPYGPESSSTAGSTGVTAGMDIGIRLSRHLSVGPTLRLHVIARGDPGATATEFFSLANEVIRVGAGARVTF